VRQGPGHRELGFDTRGGVNEGSWSPMSENPDMGHPPAHRDEAAMNGAQLLKAQDHSSGLMSGPPAAEAKAREEKVLKQIGWRRAFLKDLRRGLRKAGMKVR